MKFKFILSSLSILSALAGVTTAQLDSPSYSNISSNLTTEHAEHAEHTEHTANHTNNMPMTMPMTMTMESLNETEILIKHGADPMSFYEYDYESDNSSKPAWMIMHAIGMTFSFAILLPFGGFLSFISTPTNSSSPRFEGISQQPIRLSQSTLSHYHLHFHRLLHHLQKTYARFVSQSPDVIQFTNLSYEQIFSLRTR